MDQPWVYDVYTQGVACSESGTLAGPWIQEKDPITPPDYGHGMLFQALNGKWLMAIHSHRNINGHYLRVPHLFEVDISGDKLVVVNHIFPKLYQPGPTANRNRINSVTMIISPIKY